MDDRAAQAGNGQQPGGPGLPVFRGVTQLALDAKGRLAIPARHRDALAGVSDGRMVVTADPSRCLLLYPLAAWEPIQARLLGLPSFNDRTRAIRGLQLNATWMFGRPNKKNDQIDLSTAGS